MAETATVKEVKNPDAKIDTLTERQAKDLLKSPGDGPDGEPHGDDRRVILDEEEQAALKRGLEDAKTLDRRPARASAAPRQPSPPTVRFSQQQAAARSRIGAAGGMTPATFLADHQRCWGGEAPLGALGMAGVPAAPEASAATAPPTAAPSPPTAACGLLS